MESYQKEGDNTCQSNNIMEGWPRDMTYVILISPLYIHTNASLTLLTQTKKYIHKLGFEIYIWNKIRQKQKVLLPLVWERSGDDGSEEVFCSCIDAIAFLIVSSFYRCVALHI